MKARTLNDAELELVAGGRTSAVPTSRYGSLGNIEMNPEPHPQDLPERYS